MRQNMKMFFFTYDADFDEDVMSALTKCRVTAYTKWDRVLGSGKKSDPKLDHAVWPGFNCSIVVAVEDDLADELWDTMERLSGELGGTGFKVFELPILRML